MNKLNKIIPNPRISFKKLGLRDIDHTLMMSNPEIEFDIEFTASGRVVEEKTDPVIVKYCEFDREYYFSVDAAISNDNPQNTDRYMRTVLKHSQMVERIKTELSGLGRTDEEITDILVKFLYGIKKTKNKTALWMCYGYVIVSNLERYFKPQTKCVQCIDCGEWFEVGIFDSATERCDSCYREYRNEYFRKRKREASEFEDMKTVVCVDCGCEFEVNVKNTKTERCSYCQKKHRRKKKTETMRRLREQNLVVTANSTDPSSLPNNL